MEPLLAKGSGDGRVYPHLFQPLRLRHAVASNRIVSTAHNPNWDSDGLITERLIHYYARKAEGGTGIVMCFGSADVYEPAANMAASIALWNPANEPALRRLAVAIHDHGALALSQATHLGHRGDSNLLGKLLQSASDVPQPTRQQIPHVLKRAEIKEIVAAFGSAAERLETCGWDGMEITSYGSHLIEQFWNPLVNRRNDEYGGSLPNRMRFSIEVIEAVAESVSENFVLSFRMTGDSLTEEMGLSQEDFVEIARQLDAIGRIDLFHVSGGAGATLESQAGLVPPDTFPEACYLSAAHKIRDTVTVPVLAAGRVLDPEMAEAALINGDCDLVGMTRAIIADPDLVAKARIGASHRIRPCIAINDGCIGRNFHGLPMACSVNAMVAEPELEDPHVSPKRRVVIIGGGPAGLEAARAAARAGQTVIVLERDGTFGGQLALAALTRPRFGRYIDWLLAELNELGVELRRGQDATQDVIDEWSPDVVILATGAVDSLPPEAHTCAHTCATDVDVLRGRVGIPRDGRVVVYDVEGQYRGASIALWAARAGARTVELLTPGRMVCQHLDDIQWPGIRRRLGEARVIIEPDRVLMNPIDGALTVRDVWSGTTSVMHGLDLAIFVGYRHAQNALEEELSTAQPHLPIHVVGDSLAPRNLQAAVTDGARIARTLFSTMGVDQSRQTPARIN